MNAVLLPGRQVAPMTRKYLLTLEAIKDDGAVLRGNIWFSSPEALTQRLLDTAKLKHAENLKAKGIDVQPSNIIILNLIRLEA